MTTLVKLQHLIADQLDAFPPATPVLNDEGRRRAIGVPTYTPASRDWSTLFPD